MIKVGNTGFHSVNCICLDCCSCYLCVDSRGQIEDIMEFVIEDDIPPHQQDNMEEVRIANQITCLWCGKIIETESINWFNNQDGFPERPYHARCLYNFIQRFNVNRKLSEHMQINNALLFELHETDKDYSDNFNFFDKLTSYLHKLYPNYYLEIGDLLNNNYAVYGFVVTEYNSYNYDPAFASIDMVFEIKMMNQPEGISSVMSSFLQPGQFSIIRRM